ncbi:hypothetical protein L2755_20750 [Shewanella abyssi]|uniref:hypothetical protein n=1 Tax=Shewanella abyssi TaxID=311789 RepID=UPI00200CA310|nr:hypothetical protein [Shewanella abyssi]MCL1052027.1 hypothetical protein [Shewanella abyssi]
MQVDKIGGQGSIAKSGSDNNSKDNYKGSLQDQIKQQAHEGIQSVGKDLGYSSEGSVDASWGSITKDDSGNITNANVSCGSSCQKAAADGHQFNVSRLDLQMFHMRKAYYTSQTEVAKNGYKAVEYGTFVFIGSEIIAASAAKWAFLKGSEKLAYFGIIGEAASLATSVDGSAAAVMQGAKTLIPRMRVGPTVGKPKIRVNKDGTIFVD